MCYVNDHDELVLSNALVYLFNFILIVFCAQDQEARQGQCASLFQNRPITPIRTMNSYDINVLLRTIRLFGYFLLRVGNMLISGLIRTGNQVVRVTRAPDPLNLH